MTTSRAKMLFALALSPLLALSADFWSKPHTEWTPEEVVRMLSNSPWAQDATARMEMDRGEHGQRSGRSGGMGGSGSGGGGGIGGIGRAGGGINGPMGGGGPLGTGNGSGGGMGGGRGSSRDDNTGGPIRMPDIRATVRWESALPVRQAMAKRLDAELTEESSSYIIAVAGLPRRSRSEDEDPDRLESVRIATTLGAKGRSGLAPQKVELAKDGTTLLFVFRRDEPFSLDDKEVEFVTKMGPMELKRKFRLKDMIYQGKLAL